MIRRLLIAALLALCPLAQAAEPASAKAIALASLSEHLPSAVKTEPSGSTPTIRTART